MAEPKKKLNFNIVNPKIEDYNFCKNLALEKRMTTPEMLTLLVSTYQSKSESELTTEIKTTIEELNHQVFKLEAENTLLKDKLTNTPLPSPLEPNTVIYTPPANQLTNIRRYFAFLRKNGKITGSEPNLPQTLIEISINYFIKNEYSEVLK